MWVLEVQYAGSTWWPMGYCRTLKAARKMWRLFNTPRPKRIRELDDEKPAEPKGV